jgi:acetylglutamate kinase
MTSLVNTVIKVGGRAQQDPRLAPALAAWWANGRQGLATVGASSTICCVVHGGGDEVTALQRAAGVEPMFVGGRRVTRPDDIDRLRMALSGLANKRLVAALTRSGVPAVGISGEDGPLLAAELYAGASLGAVGIVRDVDTKLLSVLASAGYLPVVAPVAACRQADASRAVSGEPGDTTLSALNVNGDDAAAAVAVALGAAELLLVSDVAGVQIDGEWVGELTPAGAERAIAQGQIAGGMVAKVSAALSAVARGVARVRIGTLDILTSQERGTLVLEEHEAPDVDAARVEEVAA